MEMMKCGEWCAERGGDVGYASMGERRKIG